MSLPSSLSSSPSPSSPQSSFSPQSSEIIIQQHKSSLRNTLANLFGVPKDISDIIYEYADINYMVRPRLLKLDDKHKVSVVTKHEGNMWKQIDTTYIFIHKEINLVIFYGMEENENSIMAIGSLFGNCVYPLEEEEQHESILTPLGVNRSDKHIQWWGWCGYNRYQVYEPNNLKTLEELLNENNLQLHYSFWDKLRDLMELSKTTDTGLVYDFSDEE